MSTSTTKTKTGNKRRAVLAAKYKAQGYGDYHARRKAGYSDSYAKKAHVANNTKTWQQLLNEIPDNTVLDRLHRMITQGDDSTALKAIQEINRLKDRYPAGKLKVEESAQELQSFSE